MSQETVSIIGCGWIGLPLAERLVKTGYTVKGSTTSAEKISVLRQKGIEAHLLALNPEPQGNLSALLQADTLIVDIPPKAGKLGDEHHPAQIGHLVEAIRQSTLKHVIYVSSTSIYPELNRVVVETDVVEPAQSAASALVKAEQSIQNLQSGQAVTILRCGGLLGYDRTPGRYVAGKTVDTGAVPVNYLHRDDAVGILETLIRQKIRGVYNAVAPEHPNREAIYRKNCEEFGFEQPTFVKPESPVAYKVISPDKLLEATQYNFQYPDPLQFFYQL
ncbi:NAD(P)H-binding protein [Spirosoma sp. RP8]|uniref:NAD(P)H-binding protein n=1 Tax=Spirosoma liriopis TaxID=2937440 RepID=A0ABT0HIZ3_9BACT|nr:NAD(P)H-binding protein [Spirosoma liriopis]MCK8492133.1 NAD(P)H-binding protein [Spirosoma liriopis]